MGVRVVLEFDGVKQTFEAAGFASDEVNYGQAAAAASSVVDGYVEDSMLSDDGALTKADMRQAYTLVCYLGSSRLSDAVGWTQNGRCFGPFVLWVESV